MIRLFQSESHLGGCHSSSNSFLTAPASSPSSVSSASSLTVSDRARLECDLRAVDAVSREVESLRHQLAGVLLEEGVRLGARAEELSKRGERLVASCRQSLLLSRASVQAVLDEEDERELDRLGDDGEEGDRESRDPFGSRTTIDVLFEDA